MLRSVGTLQDSSPGTYHHHDALGNVVALTNAASYAVLETYTYVPFGKRTVYNATGQQIPDTAYANTHGYTGREHLPLRGLMDYRNRSYSTTLGRFLQTDPIRFEAGDLNLYRYVGNSVVNWLDPLGLQGQESCRKTGNYKFDCGSDHFLNALLTKGGSKNSKPMMAICDCEYLCCHPRRKKPYKKFKRQFKEVWISDFYSMIEDAIDANTPSHLTHSFAAGFTRSLIGHLPTISRCSELERKCETLCRK